MGHLVVHAGGGIFTVVLGEHGLEVRFRHAGEADEVLTGEDENTEIAEFSLECFQSGIVVSMAGSGEPDEVVRSVIELVTVEMVTFLSFARNTPSCGADEPMDLPFFACDGRVDVLTAAVVESIIRAELVGEFIAGGCLDMSTLVGIVGCTFNHRRWDAPFNGHSSRGFGCQRNRRR